MCESPMMLLIQPSPPELYASCQARAEHVHSSIVLPDTALRVSPLAARPQRPPDGARLAKTTLPSFRLSSSFAVGIVPLLAAINTRPPPALLLHKLIDEHGPGPCQLVVGQVLVNHAANRDVREQTADSSQSVRRQQVALHTTGRTERIQESVARYPPRCSRVRTCSRNAERRPGGGSGHQARATRRTRWPCAGCGRLVHVRQRKQSGRRWQTRRRRSAPLGEDKTVP